MIKNEFIRNFNRRLNLHNKNIISEDYLRYDFFAACLAQGIKTENILLEYPHNHCDFEKREIDALITTDNRKIAIEMKYFKRIPSKKNDSTQHMAKLIIDLIKLKNFGSNIDAKYFIFATDDLMFNYIKNPNNSFHKLHTEKIGKVFEITPGDKEGKHYEDEIVKIATDVEEIFSTKLMLKKIIYKEIDQNHYIGCFRVL